MDYTLAMIIAIILLSVYVAGMLVFFIMGAHRNVKEKKNSIFGVILASPIAFVIYLVVLPLGIIAGIFKPRKN